MGTLSILVFLAFGSKTGCETICTCLTHLNISINRKSWSGTCSSLSCKNVCGGFSFLWTFGFHLGNIDYKWSVLHGQFIFASNPQTWLGQQQEKPFPLPSTWSLPSQSPTYLTNHINIPIQPKQEVITQSTTIVFDNTFGLILEAWPSWPRCWRQCSSSSPSWWQPLLRTQATT